MATTDLSLIYRAYEAFNARDIDGALATMASNVEWPNVAEGTWLRGHAAVRDYWTHQWQRIDPKVYPEGFQNLPDGRLRIDVQQIVRDLEGKEIYRGMVGHVYTLQNDRIVRMQVEGPLGG